MVGHIPLEDVILVRIQASELIEIFSVRHGINPWRPVVLVPSNDWDDRANPSHTVFSFSYKILINILIRQLCQ